MTSYEPRSASFGFDVKPHAYDPITQPEYFEGVAARRVVAFLIDLVIISIPIVLLSVFILVFGLFTFGLGWLLFWFLSPVTVVWAVIYYGLTLGGAASATLGMRLMDLELRTWYGEPSHFLLGAAHGIVYWISISTLSPLILAVGFFNARRRLLHDALTGTIVVNTEPRAAALHHAAVPFR